MGTNRVITKREKRTAPQSAGDLVKAAWERVVLRGLPPQHEVRPIILNSWLHCRKIGVDPMRKASPRPFLSKDGLNDLIQKNKVLIDVSRPVIDMIEIMVRGTGFVITLTEKKGYVLLFRGDGDILKMAEGNYFMPGCLRTNEHAGTNGIGLCLKEGVPLQITGAEHYKIPFHGWTCSAAPICSGQGKLLGVINLSGQSIGRHKHTLALVTAAAETINSQLRERTLIEEKQSLNLMLTTIFDSISDGVIAIDNGLRILNMNKSAARMLDLTVESAVGKGIHEIVPPRDPLIRRLISRDSSAQKTTFFNVRHDKSYVCRIDSVLKATGEKSGSILTLTRRHEIINIAKRIGGNYARFEFDDIKGKSPELLKQIELAKVAAKANSRILITGESGTGKELFAQAIHNLSRRRNEPFVAISCAAIPRDLIESELFGYKGGAFTGARREGMVGKFELANRGSLFLDEINGLPLELQGKLLRALQQNEIIRLGASQPTPVDVRLIAASNSDLGSEVENRNFREDLYYRLNVMEIVIPPLRRRMDDLELLVDHIIGRQCKEMGIKRQQVSDEVLSILKAYPWPGNVRELENCIERAMILSQGKRLEVSYLPERLRKATIHAETHMGAKSLNQGFQEMIKASLSRCEGNVSSAAKELKISRSTLYRKMRTFGIES